MKRALILGCSHAAGAELWHDPSCRITHPVIQQEYGAQNSYPVLIAKSLGYEPHNHSVSGGSNDAMFRICSEQIDGFNESDIIIACWTGMDRGEVWHEQHNYWIPINYGDGISHARVGNPVLKQGINVGPLIDDHVLYEQYGRQWIAFEGHDQRGRLNKIKNILALNALAKSKNIKVINLESFQAVIGYSWPDWIVRPTGNEDFCNYSMSKNFARAPGGHFLSAAHRSFSQYVLSKLVE